MHKDFVKKMKMSVNFLSIFKEDVQMEGINWGGIFIVAVFAMIFIAAIAGKSKDNKQKKQQKED